MARRRAVEAAVVGLTEHGRMTPEPTSIDRLRHRANRFGHYTRSMLHQLHVRLWMANLVCGAFPDFGSGAVRARLYRLVGLDVASSSFIMGNLELLAGSLDGGFYEKLHVGHHTVIGNHVT